MLIYPAIDLMDGGCVRLRQGDFDARTDYARNPRDALSDYAEAGARWSHIVDLDGARAREPRQHALIAELARTSSLRLQVAGGFRTADQVAAMLHAGAARVVVGSLAVTDPDAVSAMIATHGADRIALALDINLEEGVPICALSGWRESSRVSLWDAAARIPAARHILVTDIGRDGMMAGPNSALVRSLVERLPEIAIQASGGVSNLDDIAALAATGAASAIVGKALWEERIDLREAIARARI